MLVAPEASYFLPSPRTTTCHGKIQQDTLLLLMRSMHHGYVAAPTLVQITETFSGAVARNGKSGGRWK